MNEAGGSSVERLIETVARLRGPDGCPWDREQTLDSLKPHLIEESYELIDAIESGDIDHHREELGDVLLQVVLQSQLRSENGEFSFADVASDLEAKLIRRHPHVFGDAEASTASDVISRWEAIKAQEKGAEERRSILAGMPRHLPSLQKAQRVQAKVSRVGFDWPEILPVLAKIDEELAETREAVDQGDAERVKEEIGDLLFAVVNLCRFQRIDSEEALNDAVEKFTRRFQSVEDRIHATGRTLSECTLEEMDAEWDTVKSLE